MDSAMMQEILDDWNSWKYDIGKLTKVLGTLENNSKMEMIGVILQEKMKELKGDK